VLQKKVDHQTHGSNLVKCEPIFKIYSLLKRELNSLQNPYNIFHHTLSTFPHYLGKINSSNLSQITTDTFEKPYHI